MRRIPKTKYTDIRNVLPCVHIVPRNASHNRQAVDHAICTSSVTEVQQAVICVSLLRTNRRSVVTRELRTDMSSRGTNALLQRRKSEITVLNHTAC